MSWEIAFLHWLETLRGGVIQGIMVFYTGMGDNGMMWLAVSLALLLFKKTRRAGLAALLAVIYGAVCTNLVLKHLFERPRPFIADITLLPLVGTEDMSSFPSGHTTAAFAAATGWFLALPQEWKHRWAVFLTAILMGFSRMYVGMHYPTDVAGGMLIGIGAGILAVATVDYGRKRYEAIRGAN